MSHDPLCPAPLCDYTGKPGAECMGYVECWHDCQCELIARVREEEFGHRVVAAELAYAAALRDAVEAIESQRTEDPSWDGTNWNNALFFAKEAIEALEGEQ